MKRLRCRSTSKRRSLAVRGSRVLTQQCQGDPALVIDSDDGQPGELLMPSDEEPEAERRGSVSHHQVLQSSSSDGESDDIFT
eukprot:SAG31_NODE_23148_length_510_cov_0.849148_1_plen_81_part_10